MPYGQPLGLPTGVRPSARSTTRGGQDTSSSSRARSVGRPAQRYNDASTSSSSSRVPPLPTSPRLGSASTRSRSVGRRYDEDDSSQYSSSRPSRDRQRGPGLPTGPQSKGFDRPGPAASNSRSTRQRDRDRDQERYRTTAEERNNYPASERSTRRVPRSATPSMSSTSSGASLFDRASGRAGRSVTSSARTSFDDEDERAGYGTKGRQGRGGYDDVPEEYDERDEQSQPAAESVGASLWNRITEAANTLTISVSKAWESNVDQVDGEATPEGQESRLTVAMKHYYIERVRRTEDLPGWLFSDLERRGGRSNRTEKQTRQEEETYDIDDYYQEDTGRDHNRSASRAAATTAIKTGTPTRRAAAPSPDSAIEDRFGDSEGGGGTKATNRLKALREEKRRQFVSPTPSAPSRDNQSYSTDDSVADEEQDGRYGRGNGDLQSRDARRGPRDEPAQGRTPPRRVGLPSGPRRG